MARWAPGWASGRRRFFVFLGSGSPRPASDPSPSPSPAGSPRPPGPSAGCAGRFLPASPRLPLAAAGLSLSALSLSLSFLRAHRSGCRQTSALGSFLSGSPPPGWSRGWGLGFGGDSSRGGHRPSGVNPCVFCKSVSPAPARPRLAPPAPSPPINKKYQLFGNKEERCPRTRLPAPRAGPPEAKWPIPGAPRPSSGRAWEARVPGGRRRRPGRRWQGELRLPRLPGGRTGWRGRPAGSCAGAGGGRAGAGPARGAGGGPQAGH